MKYVSEYTVTEPNTPPIRVWLDDKNRVFLTTNEATIECNIGTLKTIYECACDLVDNKQRKASMDYFHAGGAPVENPVDNEITDTDRLDYISKHDVVSRPDEDADNPAVWYVKSSVNWIYHSDLRTAIDMCIREDQVSKEND